MTEPNNQTEKEYSQEEIARGFKEYFSMLGAVTTTLALSPYIFPTIVRATLDGAPDRVGYARCKPSQRLTIPEENGGDMGGILGGLAAICQSIGFVGASTLALDSGTPLPLRYLAVTNGFSLGYEFCRALYQRANPERLSNQKGIFQKAGRYLFGYPNFILNKEEKEQELEKIKGKHPELEDLI